MIRIYSDLESLSRSAAEAFVRRAGVASKSRGRFSVVLAGGHTPQRTYKMLAQRPFGNRIAWNRVHVFWGDERCVEAEDPRSNARMARHALLDHVPIPPAHIHPILCHESPADAAHRYDTLLRSYFSDGAPRFDLVYLGLGEDGHTASLFPGTPLLKEKERWAAEVYSAEQSIYRVTLTPPIINQAAVVVFLVSGASKAPVLKEVLEGRRDPMRLPTQTIQPRQYGGQLYWLVDKEAASMLKRVLLKK